MEFTIQNIILIFTTISTLVGGIVAYFEKQKNKRLEDKLLEKEVESNSIDIAVKNMNLYQQMMDDIKNRFETTIEEYRADIDRLKLLLEESREVIGRQEEFLKEKQEMINRLKGILVQHKIQFDEDSEKNK